MCVDALLLAAYFMKRVLLLFLQRKITLTNPASLRLQLEISKFVLSVCVQTVFVSADQKKQQLQKNFMECIRKFLRLGIFYFFLFWTLELWKVSVWNVL